MPKPPLASMPLAYWSVIIERNISSPSPPPVGPSVEMPENMLLMNWEMKTCSYSLEALSAAAAPPVAVGAFASGFCWARLIMFWMLVSMVLPDDLDVGLPRAGGLDGLQGGGEVGRAGAPGGQAN